VLRIDDSLAEAFPEAKQVISFRNILAHGYDRAFRRAGVVDRDRESACAFATARELMDAAGEDGSCPFPVSPPC